MSLNCAVGRMLSTKKCTGKVAEVRPCSLRAVTWNVCGPCESTAGSVSEVASVDPTETPSTVTSYDSGPHSSRAAVQLRSGLVVVR